MALEKGIAELVEEFIAAGRPSSRQQSIAQRREGYSPPPEGVVEYLRQITDGLVTEARIRQYVDAAPQMLSSFMKKLRPALKTAKRLHSHAR